jgi:hypothetical protein
LLKKKTWRKDVKNRICGLLFAGKTVMEDEGVHRTGHPTKTLEAK